MARAVADEYLDRGRKEPTVDEYLTAVDRARAGMSKHDREVAERHIRLMTGELDNMSYEARTEYLRTGRRR